MKPHYVAHTCIMKCNDIETSSEELNERHTLYMLLGTQCTLEKSLMNQNHQKTMATVRPRLEYE